MHNFVGEACLELVEACCEGFGVAQRVKLDCAAHEACLRSWLRKTWIGQCGLRSLLKLEET